MNPERSPSPSEIQNEGNGTVGYPELQRIWEWSKIGNFDVDSWTKILEYLNDEDLANAALVCKDFQSIAENIFLSRYTKLLGYQRRLFHVSFGETRWKSIICRFRNVIFEVMLMGPSAASVCVRQEDFAYFERFLCETIREITFHRMDTKQWKDVEIRRKFPKLEKLIFIASNLNVPCSLLSHFSFWYPNLKSLKFLQAAIGKSKLFEQSVPMVGTASIELVLSVNLDFFLIFIIKNRQLKNFSVNLSHFSIQSNMLCLKLVNEFLNNLETLIWKCPNLSLLPDFHQNFSNLKSLTFPLGDSATYKNELLKIIGFFPVLEKLQVLLIFQNLMTHDDLIELLSRCSSTLKELVFTSRGENKYLKIGYDLHRRICHATSNRSDICIEVEYGFGHFDTPFMYKRFEITKKWIKENGQFIVLGDTLNES